MDRGFLQHLGECTRLLPSRRGEPSRPQIIEELRWRVDTRHQQMIPGTDARDVQQVAFRVVYLVQISDVGHRLDSCLQGNDLIIYESSTHVSILECNDPLDGGEVLTGFRLPIAQLYEAVAKPV
jgi:hypothetical protein